KRLQDGYKIGGDTDGQAYRLPDAARVDEGHLKSLIVVFCTRLDERLRHERVRHPRPPKPGRKSRGLVGVGRKGPHQDWLSPAAGETQITPVGCRLISNHMRLSQSSTSFRT